MSRSFMSVIFMAIWCHDLIAVKAAMVRISEDWPTCLPRLKRFGRALNTVC